MSEGSSSLIESARERLFGPRKIEFNNSCRLEVSIAGQEPLVVLRRDQEILLDFKSFAPVNTILRFDPKGKWAAYPGNVDHASILQMGKFRGVDAILDFLHECGHLQDSVSTDLAITADRRYNENYFGKSPNYDQERFKVLRDSKEAVLRAERNAWAFALKNTRQLECQFGINIISRMGGIDGIRRYINSFIKLYEKIYMHELEYLGVDIYSKKEMDNFLLSIN